MVDPNICRKLLIFTLFVMFSKRQKSYQIFGNFCREYVTINYRILSHCSLDAKEERFSGNLNLNGNLNF